MLWAENLPDANNDPCKPKLVSFEEYDNLKDLEREVLQNCEEITESSETNPSEEEEIPDVAYTEDENGNITRMEINGEGLKVSLNIDSAQAVCIQPLPLSDEISKPNGSKKMNGNQIPAVALAVSDITNADIKIANRKSGEPAKINEDKEERAAAIKENLSVLLKTHEFAAKKFYADTKPYYEKLASVLKKAHWLWQQQNINPYIYYNMLDEKEIRRMVEDGIVYIYKNVPDDAAERMERNDILGAEKDLRAKYAGPALDIYSKELKLASRDFCRAVKNAVNPFINPFVNKTDNEIEVIISLPKAILK